ncbi:MAG: hypothetical protein IIC87_04845, partial [Chloroflexi bacterium]|nr:hypothetical protein [Chloroflexota bacterium]
MAVYPFVAERLKLLIEPDGSSRIARTIGPYDNVNNVIARPIFLPALDVAGGTEIDPLQDTMVIQEIAPGEMASVDVLAGTLEDQEGNPFDGVLSITEVPIDRTPAALPDDLFPDTVVTIQPGNMVFTQPAPLTLPNRAGWDPGTFMELWSINPSTGEFENVGMGQVSGDGSSVETIEGGVRSSSWHFFTPPLPPDPIPPVEDPRTPGKGGKSNGARVGGSEVLLHSGILMESHDLVSYQSQGVTRGLTLTYDSNRADPRQIIHFGFDSTGDANLMVAGLIIVSGNVQQQLPLPSIIGVSGVAPGSHFWGVSGGPANVALQVDLSSQPSGRFDYQLNQGLGVGLFIPSETGFGGEYVFNGSSYNFTGNLISVNTIDSPFGSGWGLSGLQQLVENSDGSVLIIDGDGGELLFESVGTSGDEFSAPAGDLSTLVRLECGAF